MISVRGASRPSGGSFLFRRALRRCLAGWPASKDLLGIYVSCYTCKYGNWDLGPMLLQGVQDVRYGQSESRIFQPSDTKGMLKPNLNFLAARQLPTSRTDRSFRDRSRTDCNVPTSAPAVHAPVAGLEVDFGHRRLEGEIRVFSSAFSFNARPSHLQCSPCLDAATHAAISCISVFPFRALC